MTALLILGMSLITFFLRSSFILFFSKGDFPPSVRLALGLVPAAVLSALIWPDVLSKAGHLSLEWNRILAALVAVLIAWKSKNVLYTVMGGMIVLWGLRGLGV